MMVSELKSKLCLPLFFAALLVIVSPFAIAKQKADTIVYGDYVVTMVEGEEVVEDGAVAISSNDIVAVGSRKKIDKAYRAKNKLPGKNRILMPGLVNGHTHSAMTLFRGMVDDLDLMDWLTNYIFPMEGQFVNPEFIRIGSELACWEMIRGGTTTFVDMYFYPEVIANVVTDCGLRAVVASPAIDFPSPGFKGWDDSFAAAEKFVKQWQDKNERITPAFGPHSPYTVSPDHLRQVAGSARKLQAPVSMHVAEAPSEITIIKERYSNTPLKHVAQTGLIDTRLIAAHMVHPNAEEIKLIAGKQVGAIHNPTSNLKLAAGISPVTQMLTAGVNVGLGTDGAASNNDLDLWEEMRMAALLHKQKEGDPKALPAQTTLELATRRGAAAIGLGDITGQLKPGMRADMIQVSVASPRLSPMYNVTSHLVYVIDSNDVVTTIVSGKILMADGKVKTLNGAAVKAAADRKAREIAAALASAREAP